jgi:MFS family permease
MYDAPHGPDLETGQRQRQTFPRKPVLYLIGAMALFTMVPEGAVLDWAAIFMQKDLGSPLAVAGLGYAAFALTMAGMRFAGDSVRNRFGAVRTLQISGLAGALGMGLAAAAPVGWVAVLGFAISGLGVANMVPILFSAAGNMPGLSPGAGIATVTMMGYSGILVAPSTIGFVAQNAGFRLTFGVLAVILLVVVALAGKAEAADRIKTAATGEGA